MPMDDAELAEALARRAGDVAAALRWSGLEAEAKAGAVDLVTEADRRAEAAVVEVLRAERPDDGIVGEEGADVDAGAGRVWLVDAIDGTLNFVRGVGSWCAAVALVEDGVATASAVWDPEEDELYAAGAGAGCRLNGEPVAVAPPRALADAAGGTYITRAELGEDDEAAAAMARLARTAGTVRATGSGTLELAWVAAGRLDGWAQPVTAPWDWHPGALLVREAGGQAVALPDGGWNVAGPAELVDELTALLSRATR